MRTNESDRPVEVGLEPGIDCPIYLLAFRDEDERDGAPLTRADWSAHFGCELEVGPIKLEPGEIDRSIRFDFVSAEIPPGEWHFALGLHVAAPWPEGSVLLSAGRATLNR